VLLWVFDSYAERPDPANLEGFRLDLEIYAEHPDHVRDLREWRPGGGEGGERHVAGGTADGLKVDVNGVPGKPGVLLPTTAAGDLADGQEGYGEGDRQED
jgi:hypothetical protein